MRIQEKSNSDAQLEEAARQIAAVATERTEVKILYDDAALHIGHLPDDAGSNSLSIKMLCYIDYERIKKYADAHGD